jgi:hypothetical protein
MTTTRPEARARPDRAGPPWRGRAFALEIEAPRPLVGVPEATRADAVGYVRMEFVSGADIDELWGIPDSRRLFARHFSDGTPYLTVDSAESIGYRVWAPGHGCHLVSEDGRHVAAAPPGDSGWWWQRLVLAQVLPIAASLQGIDLLHASAVAVDGQAVAITAEAGTGKTTLAAHLLDRGADLLADDVLALELAGAEIVAHPGVALANVDPGQLAKLGARARGKLATELGEGDKLYVLGEVAEGPHQLAAVYFLRRDGTGTELVVEPERDARKLLGSSFVPYLDAPEYQLKHLEVCSRIAEQVPIFSLTAPAGMPPEELAAAVVAHGERAW